MKKSAVLLLFLFSLDAWAVNVDRYMSGSWFNPDQNGHGLSIEVLPDKRTVLYWYSYQPDGEPMFIVAIGNNAGNKVTAEAYYNSGMKWGDFDPDDRTQVPWGTITLTFQSCNSAVLNYSSTLEYDGVPYGSGSIPLTRLATIDGLQCSSRPQAGIYEGNFHSEPLDELLPGFLAIANDGNFAVVTFYGMVATGSWSDNGLNFSASGTAVSADSAETFNAALSLSGEVSQDYRAVGSYSIVEGDHGRFDLLAEPSLYRRGAKLEDMAGSYTSQNLVTRVAGTATLSETGKLSATDSQECVLSGQIDVPDEEFNLFEVTIVVTKCDKLNGEYSGYGAQIDYYRLGDGRILRLITTDGKQAGVFDLYR